MEKPYLLKSTCVFRDEDDDIYDSTYWWDIEFKDGYYFFVSACTHFDDRPGFESKNGNVMEVEGKDRCVADNKDRGER